MMKVLMRRNPASNVGCELTEGQTGEVPDNLGRQLVASGLAQCLDPPKKEPPKKIKAIPDPSVSAVPPRPAVADKSLPSPLNKSDDNAKSGESKKTKSKKQGVE